MSNLCFVIQPISDPKYTQRYDEVFKPAIAKAGLMPYRADLDISAKNLIEEIENKIKESELCFADISEDNPNVWYELGYAFASGKDVVMVCSDNRKEFPFDVSHKQILKYKSNSPSDFSRLTDQIVEKINAYCNTPRKAQQKTQNTIVDDEKLGKFELSILKKVFINHQIYGDGIATFILMSELEDEGCDKDNYALSLHLLSNKDYISSYHFIDNYFVDNLAFKITTKGEAYIVNNKEKVFYLDLPF